LTLSPQTVAIILAIGSLVVPPLVSLLKREKWPTQVKQLIAAALSLAISAAAIALVARHDFGLPFVSMASLVYVGSQIIYGAYFKSSAADIYLTSVGNVLSALTNPSDPAVSTPTGLQVNAGQPGPST
jgi:hypothetical protein